MKIEELDLSVRSYHCLKRARIDTVEQLYGMSKEELMMLQGVGIGAASEIIAKVKALKMTNADRIRSMIDKELADYLYRIMHSTNKAIHAGQMLEWLQKPANDNN